VDPIARNAKTSYVGETTNTNDNFFDVDYSHNKISNCKILKEVLFLDYTPI
jgi:hypothetical protein